MLLTMLLVAAPAGALLEVMTVGLPEKPSLLVTSLVCLFSVVFVSHLYRVLHEITPSSVVSF